MAFTTVFRIQCDLCGYRIEVDPVENPQGWGEFRSFTGLSGPTGEKAKIACPSCMHRLLNYER